MKNITNLAQHEIFELHEIIMSEVTATKKLQASLAMVVDHDLKTFMENMIQSKKSALYQYEDFYNKTQQR